MSVSRSAIQYRPLRAPQGHGSKLLEPPLHEAPRLVAENRTLQAQCLYDWQGQTLAELAAAARRELLELAQAYTRSYRDTASPPLPPDAPILLTGHQPELYHPGVWFKNFALSSVARRIGAHAVHLVIDNDVVAAPSIRVPTLDGNRPRAVRVPWDAPSAEMPYEERSLLSGETFQSFGREVQRVIAPFVREPLVRELWPLARQVAERTCNLGQIISQARHRLEGEWGLSTCELPLSHLCRGRAFRRFLAHILAHLPRFRDIYNASLTDYRRIHGIRSRTHPVADLSRSGDWCEAPFWIWTAENPQRRRLHVRRCACGVEISDLGGTANSLPIHPDRDHDDAMARMGEIEARGVRLRPRALLTTMFARLLLGDLFFHGIGGAKYDQLTDAIVQQFFGAIPPAFAVLTATWKLPVALPEPAEGPLREVNRRLRDLHYNPQRHVPLDETTRPLVAEKQRWIENGAPRQRRQRHRAIEQVNAALRPFVAARRQELLTKQAEYRRSLQREQVLGSREYSFCLYPEDALRKFLLDI